MNLALVSLLRRTGVPAAVALVFNLAAPAARAQLSWSVYNEKSMAAPPASTAASGVVVTVPAGQRVTLVANSATTGIAVIEIYELPWFFGDMPALAGEAASPAGAIRLIFSCT